MKLSYLPPALRAFALDAVSGASTPGVAAGVTGGDNAAPVYPKNTNELKAYLQDAVPRVIVLNKTFDFRGTEGRKSETGCRPDYTRECIAKKNGFKSQDVILQAGGMANTGGCTNGTPVQVSYDVAGTKNPLVVMGAKTIRGEGQKGVIVGKGLWLRGDNIILQNVHVTNLNPQYVWGGDAIYLNGKPDGSAQQKIWIDHVKISKVGRQMLTTDGAGANSITVSNCDFDGEAEWSATCDGRHYWTNIFISNLKMSYLNNVIRKTSGRAPKINSANGKYSVQVHTANNYWHDNSGHSFEVDEAYVLSEGNFFAATASPNLAEPNGWIMSTTNANKGSCKAALGRDCVPDAFVNSGDFVDHGASAVPAKMKGLATTFAAKPAARLTLSSANFGVGNL